MPIIDLEHTEKQTKRFTNTLPVGVASNEFMNIVFFSWWKNNPYDFRMHKNRKR